jgi:RecA-family ATPase
MCARDLDRDIIVRRPDYMTRLLFEPDDDLPEIINAADLMGSFPELKSELISGVLRQGHKLLLAGPSKAGKSFALIELCIAIAEGRPWLGFDCAKGRVLYVNLELDRASCLHRFRDVYNALGWRPEHLENLDIWNLRGVQVPFSQFVPAAIRRAKAAGCIAIILDPIYKLGTGNENSAKEISIFCNGLDRINDQTGCAVIYCHHHSKGDQSWKKSIDRAAGSGVFARDVDALLDVTELELPPDKRRDGVTAWRIEGTLREFAKFEPVDVWFNYPIHVLEYFNPADNVAPHSQLPPHQRALNARKNKEQKLRERQHRLEAAVDILQAIGKAPTIQALAEYLGVSKQTVRNMVDEHDKFERTQEKGAPIQRKG